MKRHNDAPWTTRLDPDQTRRLGVEELHGLYYAPKGWPGHGMVVSLGIPNVNPSARPTTTMARVVVINRPPESDRDVDGWLQTAREMAVEFQAFVIIHCDTAERIDDVCAAEKLS